MGIGRRIRLNLRLDNLLDLLFHTSVTAYLFCQFLWYNNAKYAAFVHLSTALLLGTCLVRMLVLRKVRMTVFQRWIFLYTAYYLLSSVWADAPAYSLYNIKNLLKASVICGMVSCSISDETDLRRLFLDILLSTLLTSFYVLIHMSPGDWRNLTSNIITYRFGVYSREKINSNRVAFTMSFAVFFLYRLRDRTESNLNRRHRSRRLICAVLILYCILIVALCKGRTTYLLLFLIVAAEYFSLHHGKVKLSVLKRAALVCVLAAAVLYVVLRQALLSDALAARFRAMLQSLGGNSAADASTTIRLERWAFALGSLLKNPMTFLFGVGIGNYQYLFLLETGAAHWPESHFFQLLSEGGVLGFSLYYSMYLYILSKYGAAKQSRALVLLTALFMEQFVASGYGDTIDLLYLLCASKMTELERSHTMKGWHIRKRPLLNLTQFEEM